MVTPHIWVHGVAKVSDLKLYGKGGTFVRNAD